MNKGYISMMIIKYEKYSYLESIRHKGDEEIEQNDSGHHQPVRNQKMGPTLRNLSFYTPLRMFAVCFLMKIDIM